MVSITERFLQTGRLADLLWSYCPKTGPCDSPQLRETLLGRIVGLPDITANKLHLNNKPLFSPQQYYPLLAAEILTALERTCQALKGKGTSFQTPCSVYSWKIMSEGYYWDINLHLWNYFSLLTALLTDEMDCSLTFLAQTLGKVCFQGHSGEFSAIFYNLYNKKEYIASLH